jgi:2-polyprenyl-6-methoxyphenol hydroxylase-like FAD-dependent oxidoreductase
MLRKLCVGLLAIQDAVATANLLARKLKEGMCRDEDLDAVRQRRLWPVKVIQWAQVAVHNGVLKPTVMGARTSVSAPWPVKLLDRYAWLRRWPAQMIGVGVRPEHVHSPEVLLRPTESVRVSSYSGRSRSARQ